VGPQSIMSIRPVPTQTPAKLRPSHSRLGWSRTWSSSAEPDPVASRGDASGHERERGSSTTDPARHQIRGTDGPILSSSGHPDVQMSLGGLPRNFGSPSRTSGPFRADSPCTDSPCRTTRTTRTTCTRGARGPLAPAMTALTD